MKKAQKEFCERDGIMDEELEQLMIDLGWPNSDRQSMILLHMRCSYSFYQHDVSRTEGATISTLFPSSNGWRMWGKSPAQISCACCTHL
jgi:hypothetical protein